MNTTWQWCRSLGVALLALITLALPPSEGGSEDPLRAEVEAFQKSLTAAYEAGDKAALRAHFEHGQILPLSSSDYRKLGRMINLWSMPVREVTEDAGGAIQVELALLTDADRPAGAISFTLVRNSQGGLVIQSNATPEELELARQEVKRTAALDQQVAILEKRLRSSDSPPDWPLYDRLLELIAEMGRPIPEDVFLHPIGEIYRGDRAAAFFVIAETGELRDRLFSMGFETQADLYQPAGDNLLSRGGESLDEFFAGQSGEAQVVQSVAPGISIEELPAFLTLLGTLARQFTVAREAGDLETCASILEQAMAGYSFHMGDQVLRELFDGDSATDAAHILEQQDDGDHRIITLELDTGDAVVNPPKMTYEMVPAGSGWVIRDRIGV